MVDGAIPRDEWDDETSEPRGQGGGRVRSGLVRAALSGLAGAATVTLLNEVGRRVASGAPRMETIGERALTRSLRAADVEPPRGDALYRWTLGGDVVSNAAYYALVAAGPGRSPILRGGVLGIAAGLGAAFLPGPLGLGRQPGSRPPTTQLLTIAWYSLAGLAAGVTYRALDGGSSDDR